MHVLVPVDGSDCSIRALRFALDFVGRFDGTIRVVHFTDYEGEDTEALLERIDEVLDATDVEVDAEVLIDPQLNRARASNRVGKDILALVEEGDYDHVVMGHHGTGFVGSLILGSAAETVTQNATIPVTVVP